MRYNLNIGVSVQKYLEVIMSAIHSSIFGGSSIIIAMSSSLFSSSALTSIMGSSILGSSFFGGASCFLSNS